MQKEAVIIIIFTHSISGIWGTSPLFHFYRLSALFHLPAAIFTSSLSSGTEWSELQPDVNRWDVIVLFPVVHLFHLSRWQHLFTSILVSSAQVESDK